MNFAVKSFSLTCLLASVLAIHGTTVFASIDPATLKPLPSVIKAGTKPIFSIMTDKADRVKSIFVSYRGPGVWFSETLPLAPKPKKKKRVLWEAASPERFDFPGELVYSLKIYRNDGTEIVTPEITSTIKPADVPPVIADPFPSPIFPSAGAPLKIATNISDDNGVKRATLYYRTGRDGKFREAPLKRTAGKKKDGRWSYTFRNVRPGIMTCYVKAWDNARQSARSADLAIHIRSGAVPPPVNGLTADAARDGTVKLRWLPSEEKGIANYYIYRDGLFFAMTSAHEFTDEHLPPGIMAGYQVAAVSREEIIGPRSEPLLVPIPATGHRPPRVWLSHLWEQAPVYPGLTIDGGAEDDDPGDAVTTLRLTFDNGFTRTIQGESLRRWFFTIPSNGLSPGRHTLAMEAMDSRGGVSRKEAILNVSAGNLKPLTGKTITIDAGHGLYWTGEKWSYQRPYCDVAGNRIVFNYEIGSSGQVEDEITSMVAEKVVRQLQSLGATVLTTRELDRGKGNGISGYPQWQEGALCYLTGDPATAPKWRRDDVHVRWQYAEHMGSDIMVSIHANLGKMSGTETIYSYEDARDRELATAIQGSLIRELRKVDPSWVDRRAKTDLEASAHFDAVVKRPSLPSVIVELGFNDNLKDHRRLEDPEFQESMARGITAGVVRYFGKQAGLSASSRNHGGHPKLQSE